MARVHCRSAMERARRPHDDGQRERERPPLPSVELQRREHRHRDHRYPRHKRHRESSAQHRHALERFFVEHLGGGVFNETRAVARLLHLRDHLRRRHAAVEGDSGRFRRKVHRRLHAVKLVEGLLHFHCARAARHARDGKVELVRAGDGGDLGCGHAWVARGSNPGPAD